MKVKFTAQLKIATLIVLIVFLVPSRAVSDEKSTKRDESGKALSRSKASVWVDTNRGSIFSSSLGSSQLEKSAKPNGDPTGRSSNMLLTLLLQPMQQQQPMAVTPVNYNSEAQFKPIMLLLQQQQDISERVLEKQEKLEKMNVHLQQQVKHQQQLIVDLLEQIKLFLEAIGESSSAGGKSGAVSRQPSPMSSDDPNFQQTSSSSAANAVVTVPRQKKGSDQDYALPNNIPVGYPIVAPEYAIRPSKRIPPIVVSSQSDTVEYIKLNNTTSDANQKPADGANYPGLYYPGYNNNNSNGIAVAQQPSLYKTLEAPLNMGDINKQMAAN